MSLNLRKSLTAGVVFVSALCGGTAVQAQTTSLVTRPDGTTIETAIISPTSIRVTVSGGADFQQPMVVNYTNISYTASEIVYEGTVSYKGVTEAVSCRVNTRTQAVTGTGACQNALGGASAGTSTAGSTATTTTGSTTTTTTTTGVVQTTTTLSDATTVTTTIPTLSAADQGRAWIRSGALTSLLPGDGVSTALNALAGVSSTQLDAVFEAFEAMASDVDRAAAAQQLQPNSPSATATNAVATAKAVAGAVLARAAAVRGGGGVSTGDATNGLGLWIQPFGYGARQDRRDGQDGYDDRTFGVAVGADKLVGDGFRVGLALTYVGSNIDGRDASSGDGTRVRGGHAAVYAQYETRSYYVVGQLGGGVSGYDGSRYISGLNQTADSDYRGWQIGARVDAGAPMSLGGAWQAVPMVGLAYVHSHTNGYTENGAGALNLTVESARNNSLTGSLGGRIGYAHAGDGAIWTPYLQAVANYDFIGDRPSSTSSFASFGGAAFVTQGAKPARLGGDFTAGLDVASAGGVTLNLAYTYALREDFHAHGGSLRARFQY